MTPERRRSHREGILRLGDVRTELLFVTLDKSEGGFSPTTSCGDYAISRDHFHWETQKLETPMPAALFERFAALLAA